MPEIAIAKALGFRTPTAGNSSRFYGGGVQDARCVLAGQASDGLLNGVARSLSIQFGTGAADTPPNTSFTCTPAEMLGGSDPERVLTDGSGNQSIGGGRVVWNAAAKTLRTLQRQDDALVSNCPRCQVYFHAPLHRSMYYRFVIHAQFGDATTPWPAWVFNETSILFFQINGETSVPPFDIQLRAASNGDTALRDIVFLRRRDNGSSVTPGGPRDGLIGDGSGQDYVLILPNKVPGDLHRIAIDFRADWVGANGGGAPYLAIWYEGVLQQLHAHVGGGYAVTDQTIYPVSAYTAGTDYYLPMIGIYRVTYQGAKAPDDCAVLWHRAEMQQFATAPDWPPLLEA